MSVVRLLSALLIIAAIGWQLGHRFFGRRRLQIPNSIILISIDTCRADYIGCYNPARKTTPNIDAFAQQATLFENATSPVPITFPAHCSMLTGLIPPTHGVRSQPGFKLPDDYFTLARVLRTEGFSTGAIVSSIVLNGTLGLQQGFDTYDDLVGGPNDTRPDERLGEETSAAAVAWLDEHQDDEKLFLFVHYYDPHAPYEAPPSFASRFGSDDADQYAAEIAYVDFCIGKVFDKLKELGLYDDSLIIVTADHGEMLGEHGEMQHQYFIYESAIRVPLLIKLPGQRQARRVAEMAGLVDIVPTVCSLVRFPRTPPLPGMDLTLRLVGEGPSSPPLQRYLYCESIVPYFYGANPLFGQVGQRWKYIQTTRPELYDLQADPGETRNLLSADLVTDARKRAAYMGRAREMQDRIKQLLTQRPGVGASSSRVKASEETIHRLVSLGYMNVTDEDTFEFDRTRKDAKDTIDLYGDCERALRLYASGQKEQALTLLEHVVVECPQLTSAKEMVTRIRREIGLRDE